jgi:hypothetical protein
MVNFDANHNIRNGGDLRRPAMDIDQTQKLNVKIPKDIEGLKATAAGCDEIRSGNILSIRAMLDR